jgi:hypothetical protein
MATDLDTQPTTTQQRITCPLKKARLLPDRCCCLSDMGNYKTHRHLRGTTIAGLDGAGQWLDLSGHRNSQQWISSYGATLKPSFTCRHLIFFPPFNSRSSDMEIFRTLYIFIFTYSSVSDLTLSDPTSNLVRQYDFPIPLRCRKTSDTVFVAFVRPLSEPVRRFSSCSTDFSQQIAQVILFLFLYVFLF